MGAAVLFSGPAGRVLLVEPTYKLYWAIPGGAVEADESPYDAAVRELKEELGLSCAPGRLLAVDWVPPRPGRSEGLMLVFDECCLPRRWQQSACRPMSHAVGHCGLPAGCRTAPARTDIPLSINKATGLITGTETDTVNVTATDTTGATGSNSFTWTTAYCTRAHCHQG